MCTIYGAVECAPKGGGGGRGSYGNSSSGGGRSSSGAKTATRTRGGIYLIGGNLILVSVQCVVFITH